MIKNAIYAAAVAFAFAACTAESDMQPATGYVVVDGLAAATAQHVTVATRLVDAGFAIEIKDQEGTVVRSFAPGDATAAQKIELSPGNYTLHAYTANQDAVFADGELGEPKYDGTVAFTVVEERTSYITLQVPMTGTAVALSLPDEFGGWFSAYTFAVTLDGRTVTLTPGQTAYFGTPGEASYTMTATNADGEAMSSSGTFSTSSNTLYTVTYQLETNTVHIR